MLLDLCLWFLLKEKLTQTKIQFAAFNVCCCFCCYSCFVLAVLVVCRFCSVYIQTKFSSMAGDCCCCWVNECMFCRWIRMCVFLLSFCLHVVFLRIASDLANSENPVYPKKAKCADVFNGYKIVPKQRYKAITLLNHNGRLRLTVIIHVNNAKISIHKFFSKFRKKITKFKKVLSVYKY